jgi:hypothetical protein
MMFLQQVVPLSGDTNSVTVKNIFYEIHGRKTYYETGLSGSAVNKTKQWKKKFAASKRRHVA